MRLIYHNTRVPIVHVSITPIKTVHIIRHIKYLSKIIIINERTES